MVIGKSPIARQAGVLREQALDVILAMRPVGVPRDLALLPGGQRLVEVTQRAFRLAVQRLGLLGQVDATAGPRQCPQLFGLPSISDRGFSNSR